MVFADTQWFKPTTEKDVTAILDANKGKKIRFLLGNTAKGKRFYSLRMENVSCGISGQSHDLLFELGFYYSPTNFSLLF